MANIYSLDFNGSSQYGKKDNPANLDALTAVCLELWFKAGTLPSSGNYMFLGGYGAFAAEAETSVYLALYNNSGTVRLWGRISYLTSTSTTIIGNTTAISADTWYHAAITYDGSNLRLWLGTAAGDDAEDVAAVALASKTLNTPGTSNDSVFVGARGLTNESDIASYFDGLIDDVRFWNTNRTGVQLNANKKTELTGSESGLVTYYKNNEGTGTSVNDETSSNNDLTLTGTPTWSTDIPFTGVSFVPKVIII